MTAITTAGDVYGWGVNTHCQAIGRHLDSSVTRDGGLYTWGCTQGIAAFDYAWCGSFNSGTQSYSFVDIPDPTSPAEASSRPIRQIATGTVKVR